MEQEIIGKFIKELRKKNNISQQQLATKLGVTSQAVSKWETGKNIPDISTIKQISKEFNINIDDIINGKIINTDKTSKQKINYKKVIFFGICLLILFSIIALVIYTTKKNNDYQFKIVSSSCKNFNISGTLAYNKNKSSIYINRIKYCGGNDQTTYKIIDCSLYETTGNTDILITKAPQGKNQALDNYLQNLEFTINNYSHVCKKFNDKNLFLRINATTKEDKIISYKISLKLNETC